MFSSGFILGFHGCDKQLGEEILSGQKHVSISDNSHDWLGTGAYFWENSPQRALRWAELVMQHPQHFRHRITRPFVIGAVIEIGACLDLTESESLRDLKEAHELFEMTCRKSEVSPPENESGFPGDLDLVKRHLDCAVINFTHFMREEQNLPVFDTVRGAFPEGRPLYEGSRIMENTHVQICVRQPQRSIRGYFRPLTRKAGKSGRLT